MRFKKEKRKCETQKLGARRRYKKRKVKEGCPNPTEVKWKLGTAGGHLRQVDGGKSWAFTLPPRAPPHFL